MPDVFRGVYDDLWVDLRMVLTVIIKHAVAIVVQMVVRRLRLAILQNTKRIDREWSGVQHYGELKSWNASYWYESNLGVDG